MMMQNIQPGQLIIYLLAINAIAFIVFGIDKAKAKMHRWRIPETVLFFLATIGGSFGALAGMIIWHHKTRKSSFTTILPALFIIHTFLVLLFFI